MRLPIVLTVFRRELRDVLRDRRTLFAMLVMPILLYPALVIGFAKLSASRAEAVRTRAVPVVVQIGGRALLANPTPAPDGLAGELLKIERFRFLVHEDPPAAVQSGEIALFLNLPADLEVRLNRGEEVEVVPTYKSSNEESRAALDEVARALNRDRHKNWPLALERNEGDLATAEERGGRLFGGVVAMMVILMALTGAFYPALDLGAGEKERGTLETLLLTPVARTELVAGKYLTVLAVAVTAALMNLASMTLTFGAFSSMVAKLAGTTSVAVPPWAFLVMLLGLILVAGLFSAVCLALSSFARTYKEGQAWLTPTLLVVMPLSMVGLLPDTKLTADLAVIPVANLALLMKGLLLGEVPTDGALLTFGTLLLSVVAALAWAASIYNREDVLFREGPPRFGWKLPPGMARPKHPPLMAAVLGVLFGLVWMFHAGGVLGVGPGDALRLMVGTQLGLAALGFLFTSLTFVGPRQGLGLFTPSPRGLAVGLALAALSIGMEIGLLKAFEGLVGNTAEAAAAMEAALRPIADNSFLLLVLVAAVLPAVAEEILFRGLLLRGLSGVLRRPAVVVAIQGALFGIYHDPTFQHPTRIVPQALLGMFLGLLTLRTRSIVPAMLAHGAHNAALLSLHFHGPDAQRSIAALSPAALGVISVGSLLAILLLFRFALRQETRGSD